LKKIGIFPGAFDPVHEGHLTFAKKALENGLTEVYFLPEPVSRMKPKISDIQKRIVHLKKAINNPKIKVLEPHQDTFTTEKTMKFLADKFSSEETVLLFGDDILDHIKQWDDLDQLASASELLIATRHYSPEEIAQKFNELSGAGINFKYQVVQVDMPISSTKLRHQDNKLHT